MKNLSKCPWLKKGPKSDVVIYSSANTKRNFADLPFTHMADADTKIKIDSVFSRYLQTMTGDCSEVIFFRFDESSHNQKPCRSFLMPEKSGNGTSIILNILKGFSVSFLADEHINIKVVKPGLNTQKASKEAVDFSNEINTLAPYAFSDKYGYLTESLQDFGCAFSCETMLHLPALSMIHAVNDITRLFSKSGVTLEQFNSASKRNAGSLFRLKNRYSFGLSEKEISGQINEISQTLWRMETEARDDYYQNSREELSDIIMRSLGICERAVILDYDESLEHISNIRLGVILSTVKNIKLSDITEILFKLSCDALEIENGSSFRDRSEERKFRSDFIKKKLF